MIQLSNMNENEIDEMKEMHKMNKMNIMIMRQKLKTRKNAEKRL